MYLQALEVLDGNWKLVYTSSNQALAFLDAASQLPGIAVGDICQTIDGRELTATNRIQLAAPFLVDLTASNGFEVRTPRQFKVKFVKAGLHTRLQTPEILTSIDVPDSVKVGSVEFKLDALQNILKPVSAGLDGLQSLLRFGTSPEFSALAVPASFMLTTYIDSNMRIARGADNASFVFVKDIIIQ